MHHLHHGNQKWAIPLIIHKKLIQQAHFADRSIMLTNTPKKHLLLKINLIHKIYISFQELAFPQLRTGSSSQLRSTDYKILKRQILKYFTKYYMHTTTYIMNHSSFSWWRKPVISRFLLQHIINRPKFPILPLISSYD